MGKGVHDKKSQWHYIDNRVHLLSHAVKSIDVETADTEDLDRVIDMLENLTFKCRQFRKDWG